MGGLKLFFKFLFIHQNDEKYAKRKNQGEEIGNRNRPIFIQNRIDQPSSDAGCEHAIHQNWKPFGIAGFNN